LKVRPVKKLDDGKTYEYCSAEEATHIWVNFPGPHGYQILPVRGDVSPKWNWDGNVDEPTITPSIRTKAHDFVCHSYITKGKVQFLADCTHEYAGKTMNLLEVDI